MRLTPEQQKVLEDNMGLPYSLAREYRTPVGWDHEDWLQEVFVTVCKAIATYDPAKGSLTTWAHRWVYNKWGTENGKRHRVGYHLKYSHVPITSTTDEPGGVQEMLVGRPIRADFLEQEAAEFFLRCLDPKAAEMLRLISEDWTHRDIARKYGVSRQRVSQIIGTARDWLVELFPEEPPPESVCRCCSLPMAAVNRAVYCHGCAEYLVRKKKLRYWRVRNKKRRRGKGVRK